MPSDQLGGHCTGKIRVLLTSALRSASTLGGGRWRALRPLLRTSFPLMVAPGFTLFLCPPSRAHSNLAVQRRGHTIRTRWECFCRICKTIAFSNVFLGFAEFVPINTLSPAEGRFAVARCAESLLFPRGLHEYYIIRGWFFLPSWSFYCQMCRIIAFSNVSQGFAEFVPIPGVVFFLPS